MFVNALIKNMGAVEAFFVANKKLSTMDTFYKSSYEHLRIMKHKEELLVLLPSIYSSHDAA